MDPGKARVVRFGVFELDLASEELRKSGVRVKLTEQPFQVLVTLLERPGELIKRDELRQKLWADDTFVDFDHSLNAAINKLREALGDSAGNPRFVETVPRRGYRFIAPVEGAVGPEAHVDSEDARSAAAVASGASDAPGQFSRHPLRIVVAVQSVLLLAAIGFILARWIGEPESAAELPLRRFTIEPDNLVTAPHARPAISPNGKHIVYVVQDGNETMLEVYDLARDQSRQLEDTQGGRAPFWSPGSDFVAFIADNDLKKVRVDGGPAITLAQMTRPFMPGGTWSPDSEYVLIGELALYKVPASGGDPIVVGDEATWAGLGDIYPYLVIHFTLVGGRVLGSNVSVGQCLTENQLFDESVEDLAYVAGLSTVEAKGEFVEVALEMHFTHLPLVSRSQPALQQRGNQVNMREFLGCQPRVSRRVGDPVAVAGFLQAPVTPPAVGMDQTAWLHTVAHKTHQTRARCVGDMAQTDPPHSAAFQFHRNHNQGFAHKLSPANVLLLAAQVSLVDLDTSAQPFPSQPNHRLPQLRQHQPGRLIAAQTEFTLQTLSAQPCFLGAGQPHCQKPTPQRHPRVVQDGSRSGRGLASAGATEHRASPRRPTLRGRAVRTNESRGPADADQILATGLLAGKPFSELHQMLWKVLAQLPRSSPPTARVQG